MQMVMSPYMVLLRTISLHKKYPLISLTLSKSNTYISLSGIVRIKERILFLSCLLNMERQQVLSISQAFTSVSKKDMMFGIIIVILNSLR